MPPMNLPAWSVAAITCLPGTTRILAQVAGIRQSANHHGRTIPQLIRKALGCTRKAGIHAVKAFHQQLEVAHGTSLRGQIRP